MTTTQKRMACICGGTYEVLDAYGHSWTGVCRSCNHASLVIEHSRFELNVRLADFHLKRGDGGEQRPLDDLTMAHRLVECLHDERWPSPATRVDFGIHDTSHFRALQYAVTSGVNAYDLDRVMGDGPAITSLLRGIPGQPEMGTEFRTAYGGMACFFEDYDDEA